MTHQPVADKKTQTQEDRANQQYNESRDNRLKSTIKKLYHYQRKKRR